jgi:GINS complex subunit 3
VCSQITRNSTTLLPLWLASILATSKIAASPAVTLDLPSCLSPRVLNALKADPKTVDLRAQSSHFYELAARVLELFEEDDVVEVLTEVSLSLLQIGIGHWALELKLKLRDGMAHGWKGKSG